MNDSISSEPGVLRVLTTRGETKAFYDKIAKVYDLLSEHTEGPLKEQALAKLEPAPGEKVLEIGFGTGHCLTKLAKAVGPGGRVYGVDLSEGMVALSRELLAREGLSDRCELICGDGLSLPWADGALDAVLMTFTLELFDTAEIPLVLAECRRVLRPGGRIVVLAVSKEGPQDMAIKAYEWTHRHFPNLMDCRPIYTRRGLEAAGFQIRDAQTAHMWVPVEIVAAVK
jgi:ubiquinone/menaquinone biosynthesis C-methylase UbiE